MQIFQLNANAISTKLSDKKIISNSIADGISFNTDVRFRSVVNKFPNYLKQKIYDFKGNRILKHQTNGEKSSSSSHSLGNTLSSTLSVDVECQEMICNIRTESFERHSDTQFGEDEFDTIRIKSQCELS